MREEGLKELYLTLKRRVRPEDVIAFILHEAKADLRPGETKILSEAARWSWRSMSDRATLMAQEFHHTASLDSRLARAETIFETARKLTPGEATDPDCVAGYLAHLSREIAKAPGASDFKKNRLARRQRKEQDVGVSKRRYNKLFRFLARFETKLAKYRVELRKDDAAQIAKCGLATRVTWEDFSASHDAACFVAYMTARRNRRSMFTNKSQDRAFDDVAKTLLARFYRNPCPEGWRAIAHVMPDAEILQHLSDQDRIDLFATYMNVLHDIADLMKDVWNRSKFRLDTMIVSRGDDSSTWNALAGAWNSVRQGWLGLSTALGLDNMIDRCCLGKVMRLMAADVAYWHRASGGDLDPATLVWAELPMPWRVLSGDEACTRELVESVCRRHGVDPVKGGWTSPVRTKDRRVVEFRPTPELVHGVAVANPQLAAVMRKAGWFSGKSASNLPDGAEVCVERDEVGCAVGVTGKI